MNSLCPAIKTGVGSFSPQLRQQGRLAFVVVPNDEQSQGGILACTRGRES